MAEKYALLFHWYRTPLSRSIRLLILFFTVFVITANIQAGLFPNVSLFFLIWFTIVEIFFHFKIARVRPDTTVQNADKSPVRAYTFPLLVVEVASRDVKHFILQLAKHSQIRLLLDKATIVPDEMQYLSVTKEEIGQYALELVKKMNGTYITPVDMMAAYLLITEEKTKLLFAKKIKPEELLQLSYWTRVMQGEEQLPKKIRVQVTGAGFGEFLTVGWTPETEKYTDNFTYRAIVHEPLLTGREKDFTTMLQSLAKATNNNIMLVGEIGSGKENLVSLLAKKSFLGSLGGSLDNKYIYELMLGPLIAGTSDRGLLEERLQQIIAEVAHSGNVILYIPEFQNILGSSAYNIDLSGAILPYLKEGYMPVIAGITPGNYKTYVEKSPIREVFSPIHLQEPDHTTAMQMVLDRTQDIEKKYSVVLSYQVVRESVKYAKRYKQDDVLPGSAVALLEDVANTVSLTKREYFGRTNRKLVTGDDIVKKVEDVSHVALSAPTGKEKETLLHLEDKLHERVIGQKQAVTAIAEAMRRLRTGLSSAAKPISFLFLGPTGVGKTETARALASIYFGGESHIIRLDMSEYSDTSGVKKLLGAPPGEGAERGELTDKVHDNPSSLILLDEFEKAHPMIRDLFLQVLEDGRLTDNKGRTVSFINSVIIATSNAGSEFIREKVKLGVNVDKTFHQALLHELQSKGIFKPELLNRFDDVITFLPLTEDEIRQITKLLLLEFTRKLAEEDITLIVTDPVYAKVAQEGYDREFGARPIRRYLQDTIEDMLAQKKLTGDVARGSTIELTVSAEGTFVIVNR